MYFDIKKTIENIKKGSRCNRISICPSVLYSEPSNFDWSHPGPQLAKALGLQIDKKICFKEGGLIDLRILEVEIGP